jgi:hypothetical protein
MILFETFSEEWWSLSDTRRDNDSMSDLEIRGTNVSGQVRDFVLIILWIIHVSFSPACSRKDADPTFHDPLTGLFHRRAISGAWKAHRRLRIVYNYFMGTLKTGGDPTIPALEHISRSISTAGLCCDRTISECPDRPQFYFFTDELSDNTSLNLSDQSTFLMNWSADNENSDIRAWGYQGWIDCLIDTLTMHLLIPLINQFDTSFAQSYFCTVSISRIWPLVLTLIQTYDPSFKRLVYRWIFTGLSARQIPIDLILKTLKKCRCNADHFRITWKSEVRFLIRVILQFWFHQWASFLPWILDDNLEVRTRECII